MQDDNVAFQEKKKMKKKDVFSYFSFEMLLM
jgi:hypothetical protein